MMALAASLALQVADVPRSFAMTRLIEDVPATQVIGRMKVGLLCGPGKPLRWGQVAKGPVDQLISRADSFLAGQSMPPTDDPFGQEAKASTGARYKLAVTITAAHLDICVAGLGLGERRPTGRGTLEGRIAILDRTTGQRLPDQPFSAPFDCAGRDPRRDVGVYRDAVIEALRRYRAGSAE